MIDNLEDYKDGQDYLCYILYSAEQDVAAPRVLYFNKETNLWIDPWEGHKMSATYTDEEIVKIVYIEQYIEINTKKGINYGR